MILPVLRLRELANALLSATKIKPPAAFLHESPGLPNRGRDEGREHLVIKQQNGGPETRCTDA